VEWASGDGGADGGQQHRIRHRPDRTASLRWFGPRWSLVAVDGCTGSTPRRGIEMLVTGAMIAGGMTSLPVSAQKRQQPSREETRQPDQSDPLWNAANALNLQRDQAFRAKDLEAESDHSGSYPHAVK
jgi:hypothetical protein